MKINYFSEYQFDNLRAQLLALDEDKDVKGIMLIACDANNYNSTELDPILNQLQTDIFGGIFPAIIYKNKKHEKGFMLASFSLNSTVHTIENISSVDTDLDAEIMKISADYSDSKTIFIFLDGFAERISAFIDSVFGFLGIGFNYIGGGAGSLSMEKKPCVITNHGLKLDSVIVAGVDVDSGIGVKHGWLGISGPYKVTEAEKTVIKELDYKPAFDVYKEVVDKHSSRQINRENFFEVAKGYPFGINKIDAEKVIRDPLFIGENNSLVCVGEVETGSFVDILNGDKRSLIRAAGEAASLALTNKQHPAKNFIIFVDCISRVLFLEDDFEKELEEVRSNSEYLPVFGLLSIGEIADNGKDYLEFYNKTSVVGCF